MNNTTNPSPSGEETGKPTQSGKSAQTETPIPEPVSGRLALFLLSNAELNAGYRFTFTPSCPALHIGNDINQCGPHGIVLEGEGMAGCHVAVFCEQGQFFIQDKGAVTGTFLNDTRLTAELKTPLPATGILRLGSLQLEYFWETFSMPQPNPPVASPSSLEITVPQGRTKTAEAETAAASVPVAAPTGEEGKQKAASIVIAEFTLLNLDVPNALPRHCEVMNNKLSFVLGRAPHCDYQIEFKEKYVAEEQAVIIYSPVEETFAIKGLVKENPIWVNNQRIKEVQKLTPGDIIRLGSAVNAPKMRFTIEGHEEIPQQVVYLTQLIPSLQRGKVYTIGASKDCHIQIEDPAISGVVATFKVPERGEYLFLSKEAVKTAVKIEESEVKENETRTLHFQQRLHVGATFTLIHDHKNFITPRIPSKANLSDFIPVPERGAVYAVGSGQNCTIRIAEADVPEIFAEITAPYEGEYFIVKKHSSVSIEIKVDNELLTDNPREEPHYGINQLLSIGDYLIIRNNHRSLPLPPSPAIWKSLAYGILVTVLLAGLIVGAMVVGKKYWYRLSELLTSQNLMKKYQENVFYVMAFDKSGQQCSSGTGFIVTQKDAYEQDQYYLVTCKHVVEPWKFEEHEEKDGKIFTKDGKELEERFIAVWPYGAATLDPQSKKYLFENSFTNLPIPKKLGDVAMFRAPEEIFQALPNNLRRHESKTDADVAILKLQPILAKDQKSWQYPYRPWVFSDKERLEVGEVVIVLGFSLGGGRLLNQNGVAIPVSCEGKLTADYQAPGFLEIDVNQTQGASGGPIINKGGEIIGVVSFSDGEKKLVYGISSTVLQKLMR